MDQDLSNMASRGVSVHTGFPNPALDRRAEGNRLTLDINKLLVHNPSSTFMFRIKGHAWVDQGVYDGDVAVIDRALTPRGGDLLIAADDNSFQLYRQPQIDPNIEPWGVVTAIIHQFGRI
jgi:hypothetical protein